MSSFGQLFKKQTHKDKYIYPERHMNRVYFEYIHKEPLIVANNEEND